MPRARRSRDAEGTSPNPPKRPRRYNLRSTSYVISGHVQAVMFHPVSDDSTYCALKAKVTPSQRLRDKPHQPWVYLEKSTGSVFCGHCTCMAGLGEVCSHVAAVLLKVETAVKLGLTVKSSTSQACEWNKAFRKDIKPETIADSQAILKGARKKNVVSVSGTGTAPLPDDAVLLSLKQACPSAVFFDTIHPIGDSGEETDSAEEEEQCEKYPQTLTSLHDPEFSGDIDNRCTVVWSQYMCSKQQIINLERRTVSQSVCPLWFEHRKGRITGTKAHTVVHRRETTDPSNLTQQIVGYKSHDLSKLTAIRWGIDNESVARTEYIEKEGAKHKKFVCGETGFQIDVEALYMGASCDGIVSCSCCGQGIIEIKCPHKHSHVDMVTAVANDDQFMLDSDLNLKKQHQYYTQVQIGMHVHQAKYCDFIVWTTCDVHVQRICYNPEFCLHVVSVCKSFFMQHILPELITRRLEVQGNLVVSRPADQSEAADKPVEVWCICREPAYGKMIACDNSDCAVEWCHYKCVKVVRKPRGKWFCPECSGER